MLLAFLLNMGYNDAGSIKNKHSNPANVGLLRVPFIWSECRSSGQSADHLVRVQIIWSECRPKGETKHYMCSPQAVHLVRVQTLR